MLSDPIGDMIARIRNAYMRSKDEVLVPASRLKASVLDALAREGYIQGYSQEDGQGSQKVLKVVLKYFNGRSVIQQMKRVSKPSIQIYTSVKKMMPIANGLGSAILSTSKGVLSDREAKYHAVGGKILLTIR